MSSFKTNASSSSFTKSKMELPGNISPYYFTKHFNLVPNNLRLFGQRLVARRDSGDNGFHYRKISAVKQ